MSIIKSYDMIFNKTKIFTRALEKLPTGCTKKKYTSLTKYCE